MKLRLFYLFVIVTLVHSCQWNSDADFASDPALFTKYLARFSAGRISTHDPIRVDLAFEKSKGFSASELDASLFDISPKVEGSVKAMSNQTVAFVPKEPLDPDTSYHVTLHLSKLVKTPDACQDFKFVVKTIKSDFEVQLNDLQSYSLDWYYQRGVVETADIMTPKEVAALISAQQNQKKVSIKWANTTVAASKFEFVIDSIARTEGASELEVAHHGDRIDSENTDSDKLTIPGKSGFAVVKMWVPEDNPQSVNINFSDPLALNQTLEGLVQVAHADQLKYATQGNVLQVFFANTININDYDSDYPTDGQRLVEVFQGIQSAFNRRLDQNHSEQIVFEPIKPAVRFLRNGTILPHSDGLKINFEAVNLKAVDVKIYRIYASNVMQFLQNNNYDGYSNLRQVSQPVAKKTIYLSQNKLFKFKKWSAYGLDLADLIAPERGAFYRVELSYRKKYSMYKCPYHSDDEANGEEEEAVNEDDVNYSSEGYDSYYEDDYEWHQRQDPCNSSYYYNTKVGTNVLATDLGVIVKRGLDKSYWLGVTNLLTTEPLSGAKIQLFSYQQQLVASGMTDGEGFAHFEPHKYAYFAKVTDGTNTTYVKLDDERSLSLSNFDVAGATLQKGLKGYLYAERGVWRPGDTAYLSFMLNDKSNTLPPHHPITLRLTDPQGKVTHKMVQHTSALGHYTFVVTTNSDAPTGNWEARVSVGGAHFYKSIKIETIKPNRLKIRNSLSQSLISARTKTNNQVQVQWLHGAVGKGLKMEVQAKFSQKSTQFDGYSSFVFDDPTRHFETESAALYAGKTNESGVLTYPIEAHIEGQAPGMLQLAFLTQVFEPGGDSSTDVFSSTYSPYPSYVGLKAPEPNKFGLLETGSNLTFQLASVSETGQPNPQALLDVRVYKLESRWWWDASNDNLSQYNTSDAYQAYKNVRVTTDQKGKARFDLKVSEDDWGRYLIRVVDLQSGHATGQTVFIDWPSWSGKTRRMEGESATMLVFSSDKKSYNVGETIRLFIPTSEGGRALVSIENGTKVLHSQWAPTKKGETIVEIKAKQGMAPNVYASVTLIYPHKRTLSDSPIRQYGIIPLGIVDPSTQLQPVLSMPNVLVPEKKTTLTIREKTGKPMTYTVAIVDEGLLDLTRFKTPNAWDAFYCREALGVRTWDIFDEVMGAYGGRLQQVFKVGGDQEAGGAKAKKANRFKPVVIHLGPFKLEAGKTATHTVQLPNYIGSVRTMVVAGQAAQSAYGSAEKTTPVRSPLMLLATMPRKVSPGETITVPVTVFATEKQCKKVVVSIQTAKGFTCVGKRQQTLMFAQPDEKMAYFTLKALPQESVNKLVISAQSGAIKTQYEVEVGCYNPNPPTNFSEGWVLAGKSSKNIHWAPFGQAGRRIQLELSALPSVDFGRRLNELIQYPHGCVEQTTSSAFPQLYLADILDLEPARVQKMQQNVAAAINRLNQFQTASGGFSYWPSEPLPDNWGSNYAGHFLIEAEKKGFVVLQSVKSKWLAYQTRAANDWRPMSGYHNDLDQAYRLYTMALAGAPNLAAMNRLRENPNLTPESRYQLATVYALVQQSKAGWQLLKPGMTYSDNDDYFGSTERNQAMALEAYTALNQPQKAFALAQQLAKSLSSNQWMSTQTKAYCLCALSRFAAQNGGKGVQASYQVGGKTVTLNTKKSVILRDLPSNSSGIKITNEASKNLFVRVVQNGELPMGQEKAIHGLLSMNCRYLSKTGQEMSMSSIKQGTTITAEVTVENTSDVFINYLALSQILPSGMEILNLRYTDFGGVPTNLADYTDIRDDRSRFYFSLKAGEKRTFRMTWQASFLGTYYLPGAQAEAMYDNRYLSRGTGEWIRVIP